MGIDILNLKDDKDFVIISNDNGLFTTNALNASKNIYLLSEQGYMLLVGFGENQKVILAKTIAEIHQYTGGVQKVNSLIKDNISRFNENDLIDLKTKTYQVSVLELGFTKAQWGNAKNVFLLSERGYTKLVSMMDNTNEVKSNFDFSNYFI